MNEELNGRIYKRNLTNGSLQPAFGIRPQETRQTIMKILDRCPDVNPQQQYDLNTTFYPGNSTPPWNGFAKNVDTESILKNQTNALQRNDTGLYIPSSNSELYNSQMSTNTMSTAHPLLFKQYQVQSTPKQYIPEKSPFNAHTRQSIKNSRSCS